MIDKGISSRDEPSVRAVLSSVPFRRFLLAQILSQTATWLHRIALVWVVVEVSDGNGTVVGLMTAMQFAPLALATVLGGGLGDKHDRRRLLIGTQVVVLMVTAALGVADIGRSLPIPVALAGAATLGVLAGVDTPVRLAHIPTLVERAEVRSATGVNSATFNLAKLGGPALAGVLIAWTDSSVVFLTAAGLALAAAAVLYGLPERGEDVQTSSGRLPTLPQALRTVRRRDDLALPLLMGVFFGAAGTNLQLIIPLMATVELGRGAAGFGLLMAGLALGSFLGATITAVRRAPAPMHELIVLTGLMAAMQLAVAAVPGFFSFAGVLVLAGAVLLAANTASVALLQLHAPPELTARMMALYVLAYFAWSPIGGPLLGFVAEVTTPRIAAASAAALTMLGVVAARAVVRRDGSQQPATP